MFTEQSQPDLTDQALSKIVEFGMSSQFDQVETLSVDVRANPLQLIQGEVDTVAINGKGMVMRQDLRMAEMQLQMGSIAINPLNAVLGQIELTRPTDANARVVLTEVDLNRAFQSDYLQRKLQNIEITVQTKPIMLSIQQAACRLPDRERIELDAHVYLHETGETKAVAFTAKPFVGRDRQHVELKDLQYREGKELPIDLSDAMVKRAENLLDFRNFGLEGLELYLTELVLEPGKLTMIGEARLTSAFPKILSN